MRRSTAAAWLAGALVALAGGCASEAKEWSGEAPAERASADEAGGADAGLTAGAPGAPPAPATATGPARELEDLGALAFAGPADRVAGLPGGEAPGQGAPPGQGGPEGPKPGAPGAAPAQVGPLLIYSADLHLAVHEVGSTQRAVIAVARELGGFLAAQDDTKVTIRVPARRFTEALEQIERAGDVVHRNIRAEDVGEEYRDLSLRLRNAEVVRDRLEQLLAQATTVEDALKVQRELGEVTERIEGMKGRLRWLQDRISLSTITVWFQPKPTDEALGNAAQLSRLPFPWLDELGLQSLLTLRSW